MAGYLLLLCETITEVLVMKRIIEAILAGSATLFAIVAFVASSPSTAAADDCVGSDTFCVGAECGTFCDPNKPDHCYLICPMHKAYQT